MNSEVNFPFWNLMIPDFPRKIVKFSSHNLVFLFNSFFNNSTVFTVDFFKTKTVEKKNYGIGTVVGSGFWTSSLTVFFLKHVQIILQRFKNIVAAI